jgi:hypothetical protein
VGALALAVIGGLVPAALASSVAAPTVQCKLAGKHYVGTTSQAQKLCFTVTSNGRGIRQYVFAIRFRCGNQTLPGVVFVRAGGVLISVGGTVSFAARTGNVAAIVGAAGSFADTFTLAGRKPSTFRGTIRPATATGSLVVHFVAGPANAGGVGCDVAATWKAKRTR